MPPLGADRRRALALLAVSAGGRAETVLLARGFTLHTHAHRGSGRGRTRDGPTGADDRGRKRSLVPRIRITESGRVALERR